MKTQRNWIDLSRWRAIRTTNRFFLALALAGIAVEVQPASSQPPRSRPGPVNPGSPPAWIDPGRIGQVLTRLPTPEQTRLREHAKVLRDLGISDLASLGRLALPSGALAAPTGLLRPKSEIVGGAQMLSARRATVSAGGTRSFEPFSAQGRVLLTEASAEASLATSGRDRSTRSDAFKTTQAAVPLHTAYWAADQIHIPDDTTIVLTVDNRKLFVIANQIKVGKNVTFSYERSTADTPPSVPPKPGKPGPPATPSPFSQGSPGAAGTPGASGAPGLSYDADPNGAAPQIEIWTLDLQGSPAFDLKGQDGGPGGRGGDGGDGGDGGPGSDSVCARVVRIGWNCKSGPGDGGHGGPGGKAGAGGPGGNGGAGGRLALYAPQASITSFSAGFFATVDGGAPGPGGIPGTPGAGGAGGPVGKVLCDVCNKPATRRTAGSPGAQGAAAPQGPAGKPGIVQQPDPIRFASIAQAEFDAELTRPTIDHFASAVSPQGRAVQGETVTVHGSRFTPTDTVFVLGPTGQGVASPTTFLGSALLKFQVPAVPGGFRSVQVRRANGQTSNPATLYVLPTLGAVVPGPRITPGDSIQLNGTGFAPGARVRIDNLDIGEATYAGPNALSIQLVRPPTMPPKPLTVDGGEPAQLTVALADGTVTAPLPVVLDTFRILVFGDSIVWGTGLQEPQKFHSLVEVFVRDHQPGNRRVSKSVAAHTGARVGLTPFDGTALPALPGEVPTPYPTIFRQAEAFFGRPEAPYVDLILLDGCANDSGMLNWMDPRNDKAWIEQSVAYHCHDGMLQLLDRLAQEFKAAKIIVTGHYAPLGPNSDGARLAGFMTAINSTWYNIPGYIVAGVLAPGAKDKIVANCATFATASNLQLARAVDDATAKLAAPRIYFADPGFDPAKHAAMSGSESLIYGLRPNLEPEDPEGVAEARRQACQAHKDRTDVPTCVRASAGHPNPKGAQRYFQAILPFL
jgi:hypothetical protein